MLGTAIVVYGRKAGISAWGHASVRFLACEGGRLVDEEVEIYRFTRRTHAQLAVRHPGSRFSDEAATLRRNRGRLYLRVVPDPVDDGHYAKEIARNREIHESWLPLDPESARALRDGLHDRVDAQLAALESDAPIPEGRYVGMGRNCTVTARTARAALEGIDGEAKGVYPMRMLAALEDHPGVIRVLHPSSHALRLALEAAGSQEAFVEGLPGGMARPRPLLRRHLAPVDRFWTAHLAERVGTPQAPPLLEPVVNTDPGSDTEILPAAVSGDSLR